MNKYRIEYCEENGIKVKEFNKYNVNNYTDFLEKKLEAINYTHCSTQLKDKKTMTFTEWIESNKGYIINGDVFNEHDYQQNRNELVKRYNKIHNL